MLNKNQIPVSANIAYRSSEINKIENPTTQDFILNVVTNLNEKELTKMWLLIPLLEMVFITYTEMILSNARDLRLSEYKKESRVIRDLIEGYKKDLKASNVNALDMFSDASDVFLNETIHDFTINHFTILNEVKRQIPNVKYEDIVVNTWICMLLFKTIDNYAKDVRSMLKNKCHYIDNTPNNPYICAIVSRLQNFLEESIVEYTLNIKAIMNVLNNRLLSTKVDGTSFDEIKKQLTKNN